ncbi:hypothetical protein QR680_006548 [Steinernema hermaphroditum]|uniref:Uncharacterized protein n=1 Tax=Steinernema hermaphroditum TaxID=289476 RepID=A0AA39HXE1_9BILA|nr:hypothetical protein QR680_006548 [Steinernema hermaphroditum]
MDRGVLFALLLLFSTMASIPASTIEQISITDIERARDILSDVLKKIQQENTRQYYPAPEYHPPDYGIYGE